MRILGNEAIVWFKTKEGSGALRLKWVFDFVVVLMIFLSPILTIYARIYNFYSEISMRALFFRKTDEVHRLFANLYYVQSADLETELQRLLGRREDGSLQYYDQTDFAAILPNLYKAGKLRHFPVDSAKPSTLIPVTLL